MVRDLDDFAGIASDWFWETDADHRFTYFSARMQEVTKMRADTIIGQRRDQMKSVGHEGSCIKQHLDDLAHHRPFRNFEYKIKRELDQGHMWLRVSGDPFFAPDGTFLGYRGAGHDITAEKESFARLAHANAALEARNRELDALRRDLELAAFEDPLTGLRNRRAFDAAIEQALGVPRPSVALLHVDLDRFKQVNDTKGHPAGDMVLVTVAARINEAVGTKGEAFRIGGDEFTIILPHCADLQMAHDLGTNIVASVGAPIAFKDTSIKIGASVGVAVSNSLPTSPHRITAQADRALYAAKAAGRSCVRSATP